MFYKLTRNWKHKRSIRRSTSDILPDYTGLVALMLVAALAVGMLLYMGLVSAAAEGQIMYVATLTEPLNVREGKGLHYKRVFWADRGDALEIVRIEGEYAFVGRAGDFGWCPLEYLSETPLDIPPEWFAVEDDPQ